MPAPLNFLKKQIPSRSNVFMNYWNFQDPSKINIGDGSSLNAMREGNIGILVMVEHWWTQKFVEYFIWSKS